MFAHVVYGQSKLTDSVVVWMFLISFLTSVFKAFSSLSPYNIKSLPHFQLPSFVVTILRRLLFAWSSNTPRIN